MQVVVLTASMAMQYRAVMLHAYEHAADAFTSTPEERAKEPAIWWVNRIADPTELTIAFGAFENEELVGTVALEFSTKPKTKHKALLVGMYVLPQQRGKGIARSLLCAAIDHCKSRYGICVLQLEATQGNDAAINLYQNMGFVQYGLEPMAILTPSGFKSKVHMCLAIAARSNAV